MEINKELLNLPIKTDIVHITLKDGLCCSYRRVGSYMEIFYYQQDTELFPIQISGNVCKYLNLEGECVAYNYASEINNMIIMVKTLIYDWTTATQVSEDLKQPIIQKGDKLYLPSGEEIEVYDFHGIVYSKDGRRYNIKDFKRG